MLAKTSYFKVFCVCLQLLISMATFAENFRVETSLGLVQGEPLGESSSVVAFKGMPYALPPIGHRRWSPPEPAHKWSGIRYANAYSPACPQQLLTAKIASAGHGSYFPQSEDCLYLNVFAPAHVLQQSNKKLPVLFAIHGGGRVTGTVKVMERTKALINEGVIVVTVNYRLGIFSFFSHPELSAESPQGASGNYGTLDLIAALQWVQGNIASFGGDPDKVTITGPSGGGTATGALVATPLARGLFRAAAPMCSNAGIQTIHYLDKTYLNEPSAEALGMRFAKSIGAKTIAELRRMPAQYLQEHVLSLSQSPFAPPTGASDVVDGWVFPKQIIELHKQGLRNNVPIMVGFNEDEYSTFGPAGVIDDIAADAVSYEEVIKTRYGDLAEDYLNIYPSSDPVMAAYNAARDRSAGYGVETMAQYSLAVDKNTYVYFMAHLPPNADTLVGDGIRSRGVAHCSEVGYFFNASAAGSGVSKADRDLRKTMLGYLVSFIKTGNPNYSGAPDWKPYSPSEEDYMLFVDGASKPSKDPLPGMWELQKKIKALKAENGIFDNRRVTNPSVLRSEKD